MKHQKGLFGVTVGNLGIEKYIDENDDDHIIVKVENRSGKCVDDLQKEFFSYDDYEDWFDNVSDAGGKGTFCHHGDGSLVVRAVNHIESGDYFSREW